MPAAPTSSAKVSVGDAADQSSLTEELDPSGTPLGWIAALAWPTYLLGRGLLTALPGSRSGITTWLVALERVSSVSSQLLVLVLTWMLARLVFATLRRTELGSFHRLAVVPLSAGLAFLLVASSAGPLPPELSLVLSALASLAALATLARSLARPVTRAGGIFVTLLALASSCGGLARLFALHGFEEPSTTWNQLASQFATVSTLLEALALGLLTLWLALRSKGRWAPALAATWAFAVAISALTSGGSRSRAGLAEVLIGRSLSALLRDPAPSLPIWTRYTFEIAAPGLALFLLLNQRGGPRLLRPALALILLSRAAGDIPLHAGMLCAGALALALVPEQGPARAP